MRMLTINHLIGLYSNCGYTEKTYYELHGCKSHVTWVISELAMHSVS